MKKVLALLLALAMVFSFAACGKKEDDKQEAAKWPTDNVQFLCPNGVGTLNDVNVHTIADYLKEKNGITMEVVNNDVGGGAELIQQLVASEGDGLTMMLIGSNNLYNYYTGTWPINPTDWSKIKIVCGFIQPLPESGCVIQTQADSPYSTWEELVAYAKANPGKVTIASTPGKVMDPKMKSLMLQTGLSEYLHWVPTDSKGATTGLQNGDINLVINDEATYAKNIKAAAADKSVYLHGVKGIINCRPDDDFSYYTADIMPADELEIVKKCPTFVQVFGKDKAVTYNVPNRSVVIVPASTPDDICAQIAAAIDAIGTEKTGAWWDRVHANGGSTMYYTWPGAEIQEEWTRLDQIFKDAAAMKF